MTQGLECERIRAGMAGRNDEGRVIREPGCKGGEQQGR